VEWKKGAIAAIIIDEPILVTECSESTQSLPFRTSKERGTKSVDDNAPYTDACIFSHVLPEKLQGKLTSFFELNYG
jgi:hypothetical protein